jgi:hypothetical protein
MVATQMSAFAANPNVPITITPNTGLSNGSTVTIAGTGFTPKSLGNVLECNSDAKQPNVMVGGLVNSLISVSCTAPSLQKLVTVSDSGSISATFTVVQGTVGPPCGPAPAAGTCAATDTAGNDPTADAALYPCPPTAAQQAIGDVCTLAYGDEANDGSMGTILFGSEVAPASTTTTAATSATTATTRPAATTATTTAPATGARSGTTAPPAVATSPAAGTGTLAATGPGRGVGWLGAIGGVLLLFGLLLLLVFLNIPQRALAGIFDREGIRTVEARVERHSGETQSRHAFQRASNWVGQVDLPGRRLGRGVGGASGAARSAAHRVAAASVRTAAWFLGR